MSAASGVALLVFFAIALMCVSTMVILGKESGSNKLAIKMFFAYGIAAYIGAVITYNMVSMLIA